MLECHILLFIKDILIIKGCLILSATNTNIHWVLKMQPVRNTPKSLEPPEDGGFYFEIHYAVVNQVK